MDLTLWAFLLLLLGFAVFGLEFFVPSAGLLAVLCGILLVSSVVVGFLVHWWLGAGILIAIVIVMPIMFGILIRVWPHTFIGKRILIGDLTREDVLPDLDRLEKMKSLVGSSAIARTKMLPSGIIRIDGVNYDAVADGFAIELGQKVRVIAVRNKRLIVEADGPPPGELEQAEAGQENLLDASLDSLGLQSLDDAEDDEPEGQVAQGER